MLIKIMNKQRSNRSCDNSKKKKSNLKYLKLNLSLNCYVKI